MLYRSELVGRAAAAQAGGLAQEIAAAAVYLASSDADYIRATALHIDGGWAAV